MTSSIPSLGKLPVVANQWDNLLNKGKDRLLSVVVREVNGLVNVSVVQRYPEFRTLKCSTISTRDITAGGDPILHY